MNEDGDSFAWAAPLGCPSSASNESTKKALSKGIVGLLWEHIADKLYPTNEVFEARKNILLYKLTENCEDAAIETVRKISKLKTEKLNVRKRIIAAEEERRKQEFCLRKKRQQLLNIKSDRRTLQAKRDLFATKYDQMETQVEDCKQMRKVCDCLMPSVEDQVDPKTIEESLILVSSMSSGSQKKQVWKKISETLYPVSTPVLWNILEQRRTLDTDRVIRLGSEVTQNIESNTYGEKFDIGIAKACSMHITAVSKRLLHDAKADAHEQTIMEYIEKIEKSQIDGLDISEWLELTLEVRKWEAEQISLQKEINQVNDTLEIRSELNAELSNISAAMQAIDIQIGQCVQDIQTSMTLLKGVGALLNCVRDKVLCSLQKFAILRASNQEKNWLDVELSSELENFYDVIDVNALRKITLGGEVGAYRHATYCISQSGHSIAVPLDMDDAHDFPFVRAPLYHLLECFKILNKSHWFANGKLNSPKEDVKLNLFSEMDEQWSLMSAKNNIHIFEEMLELIEHAFENTREELQLFDTTFEAWSNQIVGNILIFDDRTVDGVTFKEWQKRFNTMASLLASKTKTLK